MTNQQGAPEALAHELFTAAQLAPGEGISDAVARIAALVEAQQPAASPSVSLSEAMNNDSVLAAIDAAVVRAAQQPAPSAAAPIAPILTDDQIEKVYSLMNRRLFEGKKPCYAEVRAMLAAPQPSPTPQADSAPASVAGPMQFGGCPECGSRSCVARECSRTVSHTAQAIPGVQWQCGPQASGFTAPQADSQPAPDNLRALFREALAWGMVYGPEIPAHQWDEMRESMVKQYTSRAARAPADPQLRKFYGVTTDAELISAQARHIERLQAKLPQTPSFAPQRVREG